MSETREAPTFGTLIITIQQASLNTNYSWSTMDPYCKVRVGEKEYTTQVCHSGNKQPHWHKQLKCSWLEVDPCIEIDIYDKRPGLFEDKHIAWTSAKVSEFMLDSKSEGPVEKCLLLSGPRGEEKEGKIHIAVLMMIDRSTVTDEESHGDKKSPTTGSKYLKVHTVAVQTEQVAVSTIHNGKSICIGGSETTKGHKDSEEVNSTDSDTCGHLLMKPWRSGIPDQWDENEVQKGLKEILLRHKRMGDLMLSSERKDGLTVFLVGPPKNGKSSLINGIIATIDGERREFAVVKEESETVTREYRTHRARLLVETDNGIKVDDDPLSEGRLFLKFADFIGADEEKKEEFTPHMMAAMLGEIEEGQKTNKLDEKVVDELQEREKSSTITESTKDAAYIIWVVDIRTTGAESLKYLKELALQATSLGIPQCLALTKVDVLDNAVAECARNMYFSTKVKEQLYNTAAAVGVPVYRTFPIKNYTDEMDVEPSLSYQYIYMLKHVIADIQAKLQRILDRTPNRREELLKERESKD